MLETRVEPDGEPGWARHGRILGISQAGLGGASGLRCFKPSHDTAPLRVPGNLVGKRDPKPTLHPRASSTSVVTGVIPYWSPTRWELTADGVPTPHPPAQAVREALCWRLSAPPPLGLSDWATDKASEAAHPFPAKRSHVQQFRTSHPWAAWEMGKQDPLTPRRRQTLCQMSPGSLSCSAGDCLWVRLPRASFWEAGMSALSKGETLAELGWLGDEPGV